MVRQTIRRAALWATVTCVMVFSGDISAWAAYSISAPTPSSAQPDSSPTRLGSESFQTDLFTGAASTSIPIAVPPGTGGMQPSLALAYTSGDRNGIETFLAPGWDVVGLSYIERSTKFGTPTYTTSDAYVLNGSDLVFVTSLGLYHTKDESFSKIQFVSASNYWLVTDKNGTQMRFGGTANSRSDAVGRSATRRWALDLVTDMNGNQLSVSYTNDTANGMLYPLTITYTQGNGLTTFRTVEFRYETRPDPITSYRYGAPITITQRLAYVDVKMNGAMVRRYELTYTNSPNAQNALLTRVQEFGADANPSTRGTGTSLPAFTLDYSAPPNSLNGSGSGTWMTQTASNAFTADFTGDGRTDLLTCSGNQWRVGVSTGTSFTPNALWGGPSSCSAWIASVGDFNADGRADLAEGTATGLVVRLSTGTAFTTGWTWVPPAATSPNGVIGVHLADINGDAKVDIQYTISYSDCSGIGIPGPCTGFWVQTSTGTGFATQQEWTAYASTPIWTKMLDLNGDGKADLFRNLGSPSNGLHVALSTGVGFTGSAFWLTPNPTETLDRWRFGDVNGDGLLDFLILTLTNTGGTSTPDVADARVYRSKGYAFEPGTLWLSQTFSNDWYLSLINTGDFNGDGKTDLISYHTAPSVHWDVHLSSGRAGTTSGSGFLATGSGNWGAAASGTYVDLYDDFDGDGKTDHAEYFNTTSGSVNVQLAAGPGVHLATVIRNTIGGTTTNVYRSSVNYANTYLPFPVQTVGTVTTNDGMGHQSTTTYTYQGGTYDPVTREFRGFAEVKVTDPTGAYSRTNFLQTRELRGRTDLVQTFNASGQLFGKIDNTWTFSTPYTGVTFPFLQQTDTYAYDGTATPKHAQTRFAYDSYGNVNRVDNLGDISITTDDRYDYTEYTYNATANLLALPSHVYTRKSDNVTVVSESWNYYDGATTHTASPLKGRLTKVCRWLSGGTNPCSTFAYDVYGNRTSATDANLRTTTTAYDTVYRTFPVTTTSPGTTAVPAGLVVSTTYWGINSPLTASSVAGAYAVPGLVATVTDPNLLRVDAYWDAMGRAKATVVPPDTAAAPTSLSTYLVDGTAPEGLKIQRRESVGGGTMDSYRFIDGLGRVIQTKSEAPSGANQVVVDTTYNSRGLVETLSVPYLVAATGAYTTPNTTVKKTTTTYDPARRVTQVTHTDNTYTSASYTPWTTTGIDANGRKAVSYRDAYGRVVKTEAYTGSDGRAAGIPASPYVLYATTTSTYDTLGNPLQTTDAAGNVTTASYDTLSRVLTTRDPDLGTWSYGYDTVGNLTQQTDAKGQVLTLAYDALNRVTSKSGAGTGTSTYDTATNGKGRLASMTDPTGGESFTYDLRGNVTVHVKTIGANAYTTRRAYDSMNRVTTLTYPDNEAVAHTYNPAGALQTVGSYVTNISYNALGQRTQMALGNGTTTTYTYDPNHFRLNQLLTTAPGSVTLQNLGYTYDAVGNIKTIPDSRTPANSQTFGYDDFSRLLTASGPYGAMTYAYNAINNLTCNSQRGACSATSPNYTYPPSGASSVRPHAVSTAGANTYTYDANGNLLSGAGRTITYNTENRPVTFTVGGQSTTMTYDATGERVTKTGPTGSTTYASALYECSAACTKYLFAGSTRVALKTGSTVRYYHPDHLGSTTVVTTAAGSQQEQITYFPYGSTYSDVGSVQVTHRYTGQEADSSTGLYYYHARYYDPSLGRFLQPDQVTSDHYMYARHNPILYTDPTGHVATRYTPGFWSYEYNTPPKQGADTSLPNPALTLPPSWATPTGINLGDMGASTKQFGTQFSSNETVVLAASTGFGVDRTVTTSASISGNEAMARFVYSQGQYAALFSPEDVAQITWDRSRFWDEIENKTTRMIQSFDNSFNEQVAEQMDRFTAQLQEQARQFREFYQDLQDWNRLEITVPEWMVPIVGMAGRDISQINSVAKEFNMTGPQRRAYGDYVEKSKEGMPPGTTYSYSELRELAREFLGQ